MSTAVPRSLTTIELSKRDERPWPGVPPLAPVPSKLAFIGRPLRRDQAAALALDVREQLIVGVDEALDAIALECGGDVVIMHAPRGGHPGPAPRAGRGLGPGLAPP